MVQYLQYDENGKLVAEVISYGVPEPKHPRQITRKTNKINFKNFMLDFNTKEITARPIIRGEIEEKNSFKDENEGKS